MGAFASARAECPGVIAIYRGRTAQGRLLASRVFAFRDPATGEWYAEARNGSDQIAVPFGRAPPVLPRERTADSDGQNVVKRRISAGNAEPEPIEFARAATPDALALQVAASGVLEQLA